jgi:predicted DNA-binding transcriptional regulator AlpA
MPTPSRSVGHPLNVQVSVSVEDAAIAVVVDRICQSVEKVVSTQFAKLEAPQPESVPPPMRPIITPEGVDLLDSERLKAADLRTALLLGKFPEEQGILIDSKAVAKLLNVSHRTLYRLLAERVVPEPVKVGTSIKRWRLAEILEWIDSDCPPQKHWTYPNVTRRQKGR